MSGTLLCIEGIDGAGKHTQAEMLAEAVKHAGLNSKVYTYPDYNSDYGKMIDRYLHGHLTLNVHEQMLLHLADKVKDNPNVKQDLMNGAVVIMDRYFYSTIAYQCAAGFDYEKAKTLVDLMIANIPSVILYLDIPTELVADRKKKQKGFTDRNERDINFQKDVRRIYEMMIGEKYSSEWVRIDGTKPANEVHDRIIEVLKGRGLKL